MVHWRINKQREWKDRNSDAYTNINSNEYVGAFVMDVIDIEKMMMDFVLTIKVNDVIIDITNRRNQQSDAKTYVAQFYAYYSYFNP